VTTQEITKTITAQDLPYPVETSSSRCRQQKEVDPEEGSGPSETRRSLLQSDPSSIQLFSELRYLELINIIICLFIYISRDSAVGIAIGYGLDDQGVGVRAPVRETIFTFPCRPDRL
jgi:hypothetical protein